MQCRSSLRGAGAAVRTQRSSGGVEARVLRGGCGREALQAEELLSEKGQGQAAVLPAAHLFSNAAPRDRAVVQGKGRVCVLGRLRGGSGGGGCVQVMRPRAK